MATGAQRRASPSGEPTPTRLFQNGNSQAVRIPKEFAFADIETEVEILRRGEELVVRPVKRKLTNLPEAMRRAGRHFKDFKRGDIDQDERDWSGVLARKRPRR